MYLPSSIYDVHNELQSSLARRSAIISLPDNPSDVISPALTLRARVTPDNPGERFTIPLIISTSVGLSRVEIKNLP